VKVAIVGGGASGLLSSILLSRENFHVDIFEQNSKVAKKILASGNGRCNISNRNLSRSNFFSRNISFINESISQFDFIEFEKFAKSISLYLDIKDDGRVYPLSNEAKSVALILETVAKQNGVNILLDSFVKNIELVNKKFNIFTSDKIFSNYSFVIIATGSNSASHLGGNMSGYQIAQSFKHKIEPLYPSLAQLKISNLESNLHGVKINTTVKTFIDRKLKNQIKGDVLFTKYGVSGFAILDSSQKISQALLDRLDVEISLDLVPNFEIRYLETILLTATEQNSIEIQLTSLIPHKLIQVILKHLNINPTSKIDRKLVKKLIYKLKDFRLKIQDTNGFKGAEVSGGGVDTKFINSTTMESKLVKKLYFTGEILDIVGERGGYNLHFAWASGYLASKSISKYSRV